MMEIQQSWVSAYEQYEVDNPTESVSMEDFLAGWNAALAYAADQAGVLVSTFDFARG